MSKKMSFTAVDFSKYPETIQLDGNNIFALMYECKHAKLHAAYDSIKRSLDYCLNNIYFINYYRERTNELFAYENITAHMTSMIVHYGRCFVSGRVKLERDKVPEEYLDTHDRLLSMRHDYIAHSGDVGEKTVNYIALNPNPKDKKIISIFAPIMGRTLFVNQPFLNDTKNIIKRLKSIVEDKLNIHYKKIYDEIMSMNIDDLYDVFNKSNLAGMEYTPEFTPGNYEYKIEVQSDGRVHIKGVKK